MNERTKQRLLLLNDALRAIQLLTLHYTNHEKDGPPWLWTLSMEVFPAMEAERARLEALTPTSDPAEETP